MIEEALTCAKTDLRVKCLGIQIRNKEGYIY